MFELFFKYPSAAFAKGDLVLLGGWPAWLLPLLAIAGAALLAIPIFRQRAIRERTKSVSIWLLQTLLLALLLLVLWQPALSIATLRPQQNVVAVVVDTSKSMAINDGSETRIDAVKRIASGKFISDLQKKFQVRLYQLSSGLDRIQDAQAVTPTGNATRIATGLRQIVSESSSLPIGAVVLMSDGAENSGGIDLNTLTEIRRHRIPIHTVGFGKEKADRDLEIQTVSMPSRVLAGSRATAEVTFRSFGYSSRKARLTLKDGKQTLATREIALTEDGKAQTESLAFKAGQGGPQTVQVLLEPLEGEENTANNAVQRLLLVEARKPRVLYIEGEPKWEYKFIRRAIDADPGLELVSMLRTTQNKIYRQGIAEPTELADGFPASVDEMFAYDGIIIGGVEANYFSTTQLELIKQFVDRRSGGVLFLAGRGGLADGGWDNSPLADLVPVALQTKRNSFHRDPADVELTAAGYDSLLCRIEENPQRNAERWRKLPYLQNYAESGTPRPGAVVLAEMTAGGKRMPLLATQNYGRGRTAIFATSGSWRWQMTQPLDDQSHEIFWQQLVRWLVTGTSGRVLASTPQTYFPDETRVPLRAEVRDRNFLPASDADVRANILGPGGAAQQVQLRPDPLNPGVYTYDWGAEASGSYVVETVAKRGDEELGRDVISFRREDGVAESFRTTQNRELLEKISEGTGGRYYRPSDLSSLGDNIAYSEAGISTRETRELWDMPALFLIALVLRSSEWLLRRKWGVV